MAAKPPMPAQGPSKFAASTQHTEAPGGLLADQTFAEERDELDDNAGAPQKKPAKPKPAKR